MMLARDEHEVTVLERDPEPVPESSQAAWERWQRDGVTQFRLAHWLAPAGRIVLEQELPDVLATFVSAGALRLDLLALMPPTLGKAGAQAGDERFVTYTARRSTIEQVLGRAADSEPDLDVRRGCTVTQLLWEPGNGIPHVGGVRLESGETLHADLVVDAMGRRSQLPQWLNTAGIGSVHEESEDSGFIYYGRFFRSSDGSTPQAFGPLLAPLGSFSILTLPSDEGTWAVTLVTSSGDKPLKRLRDVDTWTAVVKACPAHGHWLEGEPISELQAMGGVLDRFRRPRSDGQPLLTGIALLGDAWACTNPSLGRGISLGLLHAQALRDTVNAHVQDPLAFAEGWDAATEEQLTPWYRETVAEDRDRLHEIEALRSGLQPTPPSERSAVLRNAMTTAALYDPELFRAYLASRAVLTPLGDAFAQEGIAERTMELAEANQPLVMPGPSREELLALMG
jgi:2-polyprenyl-6-methoxyphenol hydroxylase-like FAD-dependent oxidoreductase